MKLPDQTPIMTLQPDDSDECVGEKLITAISILHGIKSMVRDRPYKGQPHTADGVRGSTQVVGLTMRDIRDCMLRGFVLAHIYEGENREIIEEAFKGEKGTINSSDLFRMVGDVDPVAVMQNTLCEIEKVMGIFPNTPQITQS